LNAPRRNAADSALRRCEVDCFHVAAAFNIEDAFITPAMLVVSGEMALRIGGKGSFARAAEAEKQ
jgi:hypothetical protein